jgi:hypothetical protein
MVSAAFILLLDTIFSLLVRSVAARGDRFCMDSSR